MLLIEDFFLLSVFVFQKILKDHVHTVDIFSRDLIWKKLKRNRFDM